MDEISKSDDPIYEPMKEYLNLDTSIEKTEKAYQLCGAIADTFDQYQMYRPDWILAWNKFDDSVLMQYLLKMENIRLHLVLYWQIGLQKQLLVNIRRVVQNPLQEKIMLFVLS